MFEELDQTQWTIKYVFQYDQYYLLLGTTNLCALQSENVIGNQILILHTNYLMTRVFLIFLVHNIVNIL